MNEDFRKHAPEPLDPLPVEVPAAVSKTLSCGLQLVTVRDARHPLVNFRLILRSGDINDPPGAIGVSSAVSSLLNEGTENYSSRELAEEIDRLGAGLSASSASDHTVIRASSLSMFRGELLDLLAELVLRPTFPESELELYRQNAIEGLKYQRSQPDFLADEQVARIIFGSHPYSVHSPGPADIARLDRNDLADFHKTFFVPNNSVMVAVGDFDPEELADEIDSRFGEWNTGDLPDAEFPSPPERSRRTLTIVDRPGSSQANIVIADTSISRDDPDFFPVLVMNQVLGAGASSRLFMNLREEKGYTYGAYSRIYARRFSGSFEATAEVRTAVTGDSLKEFFNELESIRAEKVPAVELADAKEFLAGVFPIRIETQGGLISQIESQVLYGLPRDYLETYRDNIRSVSEEDVLRAAQKYIHPDRVAIVIVGDAVDVLSQASPFAEDVEIFDTEGKPKDTEAVVTAADADEAYVRGVWHLEVSAQGQTLPLKLELEQDDDGVTGSLDSMLGQGVLKDAKLSGSRLNAVISAEMQGQEFDIDFQATVVGDQIEGMISIPLMPEPLPFKGRRLREE